MKTLRIANTDLEASRVGMGFAHLSGDRREVVRMVGAALDQGINFFDNADIYTAANGSRAEEVFSAIWSEFPGLRPHVIIQSKCGQRPPGDAGPGSVHQYDLSHDHIVAAVEGSLRRLQVDYLDLLLLHWPDPLVEPQEVAQAFDELHQQGRVRYFGVSNHNGPQIDLLRDYVRQPLVANQIEFSLLHAPLIDLGWIAPQESPDMPAESYGVVEYCRRHQMTIQSYGSLAEGVLLGKPPERPDPRVLPTVTLVAQMAREKGVFPEAIAIAWLLKHPAKMLALIGSTRPERIQAACQGAEVELSRDDWYRLLLTARGPKPA